MAGVYNFIIFGIIQIKNVSKFSTGDSSVVEQAIAMAFDEILWSGVHSSLPGIFIYNDCSSEMWSVTPRGGGPG